MCCLEKADAFHVDMYLIYFKGYSSSVESSRLFAYFINCRSQNPDAQWAESCFASRPHLPSKLLKTCRVQNPGIPRARWSCSAHDEGGGSAGWGTPGQGGVGRDGGGAGAGHGGAPVARPIVSDVLGTEDNRPGRPLGSTNK